jgi:hypothetical protein
MNYTEASNRFNLERIIKQLLDLDYFDLINALNKEIDLSEHIRFPSKMEYKRDIESMQINYTSNLKGIAFLFSQGIKPGGVDNDTLKLFRPIILSLIDKKQLKEEFIKLIE